MINLKIFCCIFIVCYSLNHVVSQFYLNDGVVKFIVGLGLPIDVEMPGGSLSWFTNVQVFYKLPDNVSYYEPYKIMEKRSVKNTFNRQTMYQVLTKFFDSLGFVGSNCLHRLICEEARRNLNDDQNGLMGEILHILFSPENDFQVKTEYKNAQWQGLFNSSGCGVIYRDCFAKNNLLVA